MIKNLLILFPILLLSTSVFPQAEGGITLEWKGNGGDSKWENESNWDPQQIPSSKDKVIFTGNNDCEINGFACVYALEIASGYTGTITQANTDICVGLGGFYQYNGTFEAGGGNLFYSDIFHVEGGVFTDYTGVMDMRNCNGFCTTSIATLSKQLGSGYFSPLGTELIFYFEEKYNKEYDTENPIDYTVYDYKHKGFDNTEVTMSKIGTNLYSLNLSALDRYVTGSKSYHILEVRDAKGFVQRLRFKY